MARGAVHNNSQIMRPISHLSFAVQGFFCGILGSFG